MRSRYAPFSWMPKLQKREPHLYPFRVLISCLERGCRGASAVASQVGEPLLSEATTFGSRTYGSRSASTASTCLRQSYPLGSRPEGVYMGETPYVPVAASPRR
jgi:hypothetical protein